MVKVSIERMRNYLSQHKFLTCFIIVNILFIVLFFKYIFCDYIYIFSVSPDIGSDTLTTYYPYYYQFSRMIHGELDWNTFILQAGLGSNFFTLFLRLLSPIELIMFIFPPNLLPLGILLSVYVKLVIISYFSYKYFQYVFQKDITALIGTLLWTFSSYVLIWGNHYQFLSAMVYFTMCVYFLHKFICGYKKTNIYFILAMFLNVFNSYYFFYMFGFFAIVYLIGYCLYNKKDFKFFLWKSLKLAGCALIAIGCGAISLVPNLYNVLNSARSLSSSQNFLSLFEPYNLRTLMAFLGRVFSPNIVGDAFHTWIAPSNYYERAFLSTSLIFIPASIGLFQYDCCKKLNKIFFGIAVLLLILPITSQILLFNSSTQRWTFMIVFLEVLVICRFFNNLLNNQLSLIQFKECVIKGFIVVLGFLSVYWIMSHYIINFDVSSSAVYSILAIVLLYSFALYLPISNNLRKLKKIFIICLLFELCITYIPVFYDRGVQKSDDFYSSHYYDGTKEALAYLKSIDNSVYRVEKNYISSGLNDSIVQDYNGFKLYNGVNSQYYVDFLEKNYIHTYKNTSFSKHCMEVSSSDSLFKGLLGEKYLLSKSEISRDGYKYLNTVNDIFIYENLNYIGLAYLAQERLDSQLFNHGNSEYFASLYSYGYYLTNGEDKTADENPHIAKKDMTNYILNAKSLIDTEIVMENNIISLKGITNDMQMLLDVDQSIMNGKSNYLQLDFSAEKDAQFQIFYDNGNGFDESLSRIYTYQKGDNQLMITIPEGVSNQIRLDFSDKAQTIKLNSIEMITFENAKIQKNIQNLKENSIEIGKLDKNTLSFSVNNKANDDSMLVMSLIYDRNWEVSIDGEKVMCENINGGLLGIPVTTGQHNVVLKYRTGGLGIGSVISFTTFAFLGGVSILTWRKSKKNHN